MTDTITLTGHVPSKKNRNHSWGGRVVRDPATMAQVDALAWQARLQWGSRSPVECASITARFVVRDGRADLDNKYTTLQDVLVTAGVIASDNILRVRSFACEAVIGEDEAVEIEVKRTQHAARPRKRRSAK